MKTIHVYSHTHWDYEWYFTASESIIQLIYHMDEVIEALNQGILKTYVLDSQVSILEEYLQFMPEKESMVKELVCEGKLQIGPWYTQSDELIIAGESMARNLYYGIQFATKMGKCLKVGYLPDSFGQSKDMPKLYQGFQIPYALFWRGVPNDVCQRREFNWKSNDGSSVLVCNIKDGYFFGGNLIYNDNVEEVEKRMLSGAVSQHQLLSLGGDQRYVDVNLKERLQYYNAYTKHHFHYKESDLLTYFKAVEKEQKLITIQGEFIDASVSKIHHSIYSTRYDHKHLNDNVERRLLYQLEPFMVMQMAMGIVPKTSALKQIWKKFLLNHAHDSACGCNSDQTNRSILQRLIDCDQMSKMMLDYQVRKLSESINGVSEQDILFYNTLPYHRIHSQQIEVDTRFKEFQLYDEYNNRIPYDVLSCVSTYSGSIRKDVSTYDNDKYYYHTTIILSLAMSPMSMCKVCIKEESNKETLQTMSTEIENEYYKLTYENGSLTLFNKERNETIQNVVWVEDGGDDGDTYDYSYPENDHIFALTFKDAKLTCLGNVVPTMHLQGNWVLPEHLKARKQEINEVNIPYKLSIQLVENCLKCTLKIDNKAIEHRMRVIVESNVHSNESIADTAFGCVHRSHRPTHMSDWQEFGYREEPTPIYPMLHHISLKDDNSCVTCYTKGIKEYEVLQNKNVALTLFRSVPFLGKPDLKRRPGIASGNEFKYIETPDACLLQEMEFHFAFTFRREYHAANIHKEWMNYANDFLYYQIQEINRFVNTQKYFVMHPYKKDIDVNNQLVDLSSLEHMVYSSMRPIDETRYELRVYNTAETNIPMEKMYIRDAQRIYESNMLHEKIGANVLEDTVVYVKDIKAEQIRTYEITMK